MGGCTSSKHATDEDNAPYNKPTDSDQSQARLDNNVNDWQEHLVQTPDSQVQETGQDRIAYNNQFSDHLNTYDTLTNHTQPLTASSTTSPSQHYDPTYSRGSAPHHNEEPYVYRAPRGPNDQSYTNHLPRHHNNATYVNSDVYHKNTERKTTFDVNQRNENIGAEYVSAQEVRNNKSPKFNIDQIEPQKTRHQEYNQSVSHATGNHYVDPQHAIYNVLVQRRNFYPKNQTNPTERIVSDGKRVTGFIYDGAKPQDKHYCITDLDTAETVVYSNNIGTVMKRNVGTSNIMKYPPSTSNTPRHSAHLDTNQYENIHQIDLKPNRTDENQPNTTYGMHSAAVKHNNWVGPSDRRARLSDMESIGRSPTSPNNESTYSGSQQLTMGTRKPEWPEQVQNGHNIPQSTTQLQHQQTSVTLNNSYTHHDFKQQQSAHSHHRSYNSAIQNSVCKQSEHNTHNSDIQTHSPGYQHTANHYTTHVPNYSPGHVNGLVTSNQHLDNQIYYNLQPQEKQLAEATVNIQNKKPFSLNYKSSVSHEFVAALDLGLSYSCFAFASSDQPEVIKVNKNWANHLGFTCLKTPSIFLADSQNRFMSFGFQAVDQLDQLINENENNMYHYKLCTDIKDKHHGFLKNKETRWKMKTAYSFLKDECSRAIENYFDTRNASTRIKWSIPVPVEWMNERQEKGMHQILSQARLDTDSTVLHSDCDCALQYCLSLQSNLNKYEGNQCVVISAGDRQVITTLYEYSERTSWTALDHSSVRGGYQVNINFINFLKARLGERFVVDIQRQLPVVWHHFIRSFDESKRNVTIKSKSANIKIRLDHAFASFYSDVTGKSLKDVVNSDPFMSMSSGSLVIPHSTLPFLFNEVLQDIEQSVQSVLNRHHHVKCVFLVGGFAECRSVSECIAAVVQNKQLIIPEDPNMCVVKGAVLKAMSETSV